MTSERCDGQGAIDVGLAERTLDDAQGIMQKKRLTPSAAAALASRRASTLLATASVLGNIIAAKEPVAERIPGDLWSVCMGTRAHYTDKDRARMMAWLQSNPWELYKSRSVTAMLACASQVLGRTSSTVEGLESRVAVALEAQAALLRQEAHVREELRAVAAAAQRERVFERERRMEMRRAGELDLVGSQCSQELEDQWCDMIEHDIEQRKNARRSHARQYAPRCARMRRQLLKQELQLGCLQHRRARATSVLACARDRAHSSRLRQQGRSQARRIKYNEHL
jgi:hypothetical protein